MSLTGQIANRKEELAKVISQLSIATDRKAYLEGEITELEYRMKSEKINNQGACLNPVQLIEKGCDGCIFKDRCSYEGRGRKFKL